MENYELKIEYLPIDALTPYEKNARHHSDFDINIIANSIEQFGFKDPVGIWSKKNLIVEGHGRVLAAKKLGLEVVPCIRLDDLTDEQRKAYALTHNRSAEMSVWDVSTLDEELRALEGEFDLESLGFKEFLDDEPEPEVTDDDFDEDEFLTEESESQLGDIYVLGNNRVMCGDSTDSKDVDTLVGDEKVDLVLTDPPYNVAYVGKTADALTIDNDRQGNDEFKKFLFLAFRNCYDHAKPGCPCFVFHADKEEINFRQAYEEAGFKWHQNAIWLKDTFVMGHAWMHYKYEPILIGWKEGAAHFDKGDRTIDNVLKFDRPKRSLEHPTMKPLDLIGWLIEFGSKKGDLILDSFSGSGSTLIAGDQAGRRVYTMEIDPRYVDVDVKRYIRYKGSAEGCYLIRNGEKLPIPQVFIDNILL